MSTTQADFKAACEKRGLTPSQELFSFWQDARKPALAASVGNAAPEFSSGALPELPDPIFKRGRSYGVMEVDAWDAELVRSYGDKRAEHAFVVAAEMIPISTASAPNAALVAAMTTEEIGEMWRMLCAGGKSFGNGVGVVHIVKAVEAHHMALSAAGQEP